MNLTHAQLNELEKNAPPSWIGDAFGINLQDLIFFAREGLKVAGEDALLEQIDVLEEEWGNGLLAIQSICAQAKRKVPEQY